MRKLKKYEHLHKFCIRRLWIYIIFAAVISVFSVVALLICYPPAEDGFLSVLGLTLALDALIWLPFLFKYESRRALFKKFADDELERLNAIFPTIEQKKGYLVTEDVLAIHDKELQLIPIKEILWIYNEHIHTTYKTLGITTETSDTYHTVIRGKSKKILCITSNRGIGNLKRLRMELAPYRRGIFLDTVTSLIICIVRILKECLQRARLLMKCCYEREIWLGDQFREKFKYSFWNLLRPLKITLVILQKKAKTHRA